MNAVIQRLEKLLTDGQDTALLRYSLGNACLQAGDPTAAVVHLRAAVSHDEGYSAAWKALGRALSEAGRADEAMDVYRHGIAAAERKGDVQAGKEMRVFLKRLQRMRDGSGG